MSSWSWVTVESIPLLVLIPALPALGIFIFVSIAEWTFFNHKLSTSGERTKAQIVHKYQMGSRTYYKIDKGKIYFLVTEFIVRNTNTNRYMLCQSKFMVDVGLFNQYDAGEVVNMIYVPTKYKRYHNLEILNMDIINRRTICKRMFCSSLIIFIIPMAIAIFAKSWSMFLSLMVIGIVDYLSVYCLFKCCCPKHECFKNTSFKQRRAQSIDFTRFGMSTEETSNSVGNAKAKLLAVNHRNLGAQYSSLA